MREGRLKNLEKTSQSCDRLQIQKKRTIAPETRSEPMTSQFWEEAGSLQLCHPTDTGN